MNLLIVGSRISWANPKILGQGERASISIHDILIETLFKAVVKHRKKQSKRLIPNLLRDSEGLKVHWQLSVLLQHSFFLERAMSISSKHLLSKYSKSTLMRQFFFPSLLLPREEPLLAVLGI